MTRRDYRTINKGGGSYGTQTFCGALNTVIKSHSDSVIIQRSHYHCCLAVRIPKSWVVRDSDKHGEEESLGFLVKE